MQLLPITGRYECPPPPPPPPREANDVPPRGNGMPSPSPPPSLIARSNDHRMHGLVSAKSADIRHSSVHVSLTIDMEYTPHAHTARKSTARQAA